MDTTLLKDGLYNLDPKSGATHQYARGMLAGIVVGLMTTGLSFQEAWKLCEENFPEQVDYDAIPSNWV